MVHIAGGVVWNPKLGIAVVNQNNNSWSLPKGHLEEGEEHLTAAKREIREETGIPEAALHLVETLGTYERDRIKREPGDGPQLRTITFYFFTTEHEALAPEDPMNPEARWIPIDEVSTLLTHPRDKEFFESIKEKIVR